MEKRLLVAKDEGGVGDSMGNTCSDGNVLQLNFISVDVLVMIVQFYKISPLGEIGQKLHRISLCCFLQLHVSLQLSQSKKFKITKLLKIECIGLFGNLMIKMYKPSELVGHHPLSSYASILVLFLTVLDRWWVGKQMVFILCSYNFFKGKYDSWKKPGCTSGSFFIIP